MVSDALTPNSVRQSAATMWNVSYHVTHISVTVVPFVIWSHHYSGITFAFSPCLTPLCIELSLPPLIYLEVIHHIRQHFLMCIFAVPRIKTNKNVAFCYHVRILFVCNYAKWVKLVIFVELFSLHDDPLFGSGDVSSGINKHTWGRGGVARAWPAAWQKLTRRLRKPSV